MHVAVLGIKRLPAFAGADRVVERLLDHLSEANEYTVYLARDEGERLNCAANRHYVYIPTLNGKHLRAASYFFLCCLHFVFKGRSQIAHVHNSDFGVFAPMLKLRRGVRVIGTFHGDPYRRQKWSGAAKLFLRLSEWVFVRASDTLTSVSPLKGVPGRVVHYIPNGLDASIPAVRDGAQPLHEQLGLEEGRYVMFASGRIDATKGLHHLLRAYRSVRDDDRLLVIGDFAQDPGYTALIEDESARDPRVVLYRQLLPHDELMDVIRDCSVFVFPSEIEAMSMMLVEAIACEKIVVSSDIPENVAVLGSDYPFLFRSGDAASLAEVLERAKDAAAAGLDMQPFVDRVAAAFNWPTIASRYEQIYLETSA